MQQSLKIPPPHRSRGVTGRHRKVAAILFLLPDLFVLGQSVGLWPLLLGIDDPQAYFSFIGAFAYPVYLLLQAIAFALLYGCAVDRATTITLRIAIGWSIVFALLDMAGKLWLVIPSDVNVCIFILDHIVWCGVFACMLRNGRLAATDRAWIGLFFLSDAFWIAYMFYYPLNATFFNVDVPFESRYDVSGYYTAFIFVYSVLSLIANWRFAHCALFAGKPAADADAPAADLPLTRYAVAVVLMIVLYVGGMHLLCSLA